MMNIWRPLNEAATTQLSLLHISNSMEFLSEGPERRTDAASIVKFMMRRVAIFFFDTWLKVYCLLRIAYIQSTGRNEASLPFAIIWEMEKYIGKQKLFHTPFNETGCERQEIEPANPFAVDGVSGTPHQTGQWMGWFLINESKQTRINGQQGNWSWNNDILNACQIINYGQHSCESVFIVVPHWVYFAVI